MVTALSLIDRNLNNHPHLPVYSRLSRAYSQAMKQLFNKAKVELKFRRAGPGHSLSEEKPPPGANTDSAPRRLLAFDQLCRLPCDSLSLIHHRNRWLHRRSLRQVTGHLHSSPQFPPSLFPSPFPLLLFPLPPAPRRPPSSSAQSAGSAAIARLEGKGTAQAHSQSGATAAARGEGGGRGGGSLHCHVRVNCDLKEMFSGVHVQWNLCDKDTLKFKNTPPQ